MNDGGGVVDLTGFAVDSYSFVLVAGGAGADTIKGSSYGDDIYSSGGNDVIKSASGNDNIQAGDGDDLVYAGKVGLSGEQVASLALYLTTEGASQITGANMTMDGGWTAA